MIVRTYTQACRTSGVRTLVKHGDAVMQDCVLRQCPTSHHVTCRSRERPSQIADGTATVTNPRFASAKDGTTRCCECHPHEHSPRVLISQGLDWRIFAFIAHVHPYIHPYMHVHIYIYTRSIADAVSPRLADRLGSPLAERGCASTHGPATTRAPVSVQR